MTQHLLVLSLIKLVYLTIYFFLYLTMSQVRTIDLGSIPLLAQTLSSINFSESDVYNVLTSLERNKAIGIDDISLIVLKVCAPLLYKPLHYLASIIVNYLVNGYSIVSHVYSSLAIKIQVRTTDLNHFCATRHKYWKRLFMTK